MEFSKNHDVKEQGKEKKYYKDKRYDGRELAKGFPQILQQLLNRRSCSQEALANSIGVKRQTIGYYVKGTNRPDVETLAKIADCLEVSIDYLVGVNGAIENPDQSIQTICRRTGLSEEVVERLSKTKKRIDDSVNATIDMTHFTNGFDGIEPFVQINGEDVSTFEDYYYELHDAETIKSFLNQFIASDEFEEIVGLLGEHSREIKQYPDTNVSIAIYKDGIKYRLQQAITKFCNEFKLDDNSGQSESLYNEYMEKFIKRFQS